jgi:hypothetical protein
MPVYYSGFVDLNSGHAFICDGYGQNNDDDYFHFNFGWGGLNDGYRYLDNIYTVTGSYNKYQSMITDIKPENEYDCNNEIVVFQWYKHSIPDLFYEPAAGAIYTDISEGILIENGDNVVYSAYNSVKLKNFRVKSGATFKAKLISCPSDCRHASSDAGKDMKNNVVKTANELYNSNNNLTIYPNPANGIFTLSLPVQINEKLLLTISDISGKQYHFNSV